jgi:RDD family
MIATHPQPLERASVGRRAASVALDVALLGAGLVVVLVLGLSIASDTVVLVVLAVWLVVVAPLYFALYHAFGGPEGGPGATPGQHELGVSVRDTGTGERPRLRRALVRSYGGLVSAALVVPAMVDLVSLAASRDRTAWHDRIFGDAVVRMREAPRELELRATAPGVTEAFAAGRSAWGRAGSLLRARRRELVLPVLALYAGLVALATVLVPLVVSDLGDSGTALWATFAGLIFISGIYWTQAILVEAVECVRVAERVAPIDVVRRASRRANGLTVALLLMTMLTAIAPYTLFLLLLVVGRFALVVPAIVLEDQPVLRAFGRSWQLMNGKTALGLRFIGGGILGASTVGFTVAVALGVAGAVVSDAGLLAYAVAAAVALLVAAVPVSFVLARIGTTSCLAYYDLRSNVIGDAATPR